MQVSCKSSVCLKQVVRLFLIILVSLQAAVLCAQTRLEFNHFTIENGLSSPSVLSITQDAKGFIWAGTMDGLNRYDGNRVKIFKSFYANNPIGVSIKIPSLLADEQQVWIGTNNGLYLYDIHADSFRVFYHQPDNKKSISDNEISALYKDRNGAVWVSTGNGLTKVIKEGDTFKFQSFLLQNDQFPGINKVHVAIETESGRMIAGTDAGIVTFLPAGDNGSVSDVRYMLQGKSVVSITKDKQQNYWVGINGEGILKFNQQWQQVRQYEQNNKEFPLLSNIIRKVYVDRKGRIWVGTLKGLNLIDPVTEKTEAYVNNASDPQTLNFNSIYDIFEDKQGNVWLATYFGGLNYVEAITKPFKVYSSNGTQKSVSSNIISGIVEDQKKNLWIGTEAEGLNYFDREANTFRWYKANGANNPEALSSNLVKTVLIDKTNNLWAGTFNGGVNVFNAAGIKVKEFGKTNGENNIHSDRVICLTQDYSDRIWIGTDDAGISIYDLKNDKLIKFESLYPGKKIPTNGITCLLEDSKRNMWIGTGHGLFMLEFATKNLIQFFQGNNPDQLQSDFINCLAEDKNAVIWIGTHIGLASFSLTHKKITTYTEASGLAGNKVVGIVDDNQNNLWISTEKGINSFDPARKKFYLFNTYDGLPGNVFNYRSFFKDSKGHIYFGGYKGLVEFDPQQIRMNLEEPKVELTALNINGEAVNSRDSSGILKQHIADVKELTLRYNQNVLALDYAVLNFIKPLKNKSAYILEGYNKNWVYTNDHHAVFTNLPPGKYRLLIKAANNDGVWNSESHMLTVTILPPPWKTWWAYTLYVLFILLLATGIIYFFVSRTALKRKIRFEHMTNIKQQELHQMKVDFFTHISHEIRTPLTLIVGPAEMLQNVYAGNPTAKKMLATITSNAERLLKLTNDLLDFRKADAGYTQLKIRTANIVEFVQSVFDKFTQVASEKKINFKFESAEKDIPVYFDPHHLEIVITNLLSNALKFTAEEGNVSIAIKPGENETVNIIVSDDGIGISKESQDKIFTDFYQADSGSVKNTGSGIGLAFSKSLVELHKGKLSFTSEINSTTNKQETRFVVTLLLGKDHFNDSYMIRD